MSSTVTTTISAIGTPVKLAGTTTYDGLSHVISNGNNSFTYNNDKDAIDINIQANISLTGTLGDDVRIVLRKFDDSTSTASFLDSSVTVALPSVLSLNTFDTADTNDNYEIWVVNETSTDNVTAQINSKCVISERAS